MRPNAADGYPVMGAMNVPGFDGAYISTGSVKTYMYTSLSAHM